MFWVMQPFNLMIYIKELIRNGKPKKGVQEMCQTHINFKSYHHLITKPPKLIAFMFHFGSLSNDKTLITSILLQL